MNRDLRDSIQALAARPWSDVTVASATLDDHRYSRRTPAAWSAITEAVAEAIRAHGGLDPDARAADLASHLRVLDCLDAVRERAASAVR